MLDDFLALLPALRGGVLDWGLSRSRGPAMKRIGRLLLPMGILAVACLLLFPPWYGMDQGSGGRRHGFLGYRPRWAAPSPEEVRQLLSKRYPEAVHEIRVEACRARINGLRLGMNLALAALAMVLGAASLRSKGR